MQMQQHNNMVQMEEGKQFHIVPTFLCFNISGLNLGKTGHSTMQTSKKSWLSVATWRDLHDDNSRLRLCLFLH